MPDVDHAVPHLERRRYAGCLRPLGKLNGVVQQDLVAADVDQQRRKAAQVGEDRRGERRARIRRAEVSSRHLVDPGTSHDRIRGGLRLVAAAAEGEIDPGRDADAARGQPHARVSQGDQRGHGQPAARGVSRDHDVLGRGALLEQPAVAGHRVLDGRGEGILGRATVVERERARPRGARDRRRQVAMGSRRADHVSPAVEIEHHAAGLGRGRAQPLRGRHGRRHALDLHLGRDGEHLLRALVLGAPLGKGQRVRRGQLRQVRAHDLDATVCHVAPPSLWIDAASQEIPLTLAHFNAPP